MIQENLSRKKWLRDGPVSGTGDGLAYLGVGVPAGGFVHYIDLDKLQSGLYNLINP